MKLHLGCFNKIVDGWYNTDVTAHIFISKIPCAAALIHFLGKMTDQRYEEHKVGLFKKVNYLNVAKKFSFKSNSVEAIFSSHIIEHLSPRVAEHMLSESLRVLTSEGICRVVAPSLELAISSYTEKDPEKALNMIFEHDHANPKNQHQWMYTGSSLVQLMEKVGFVDVQIASFGEGNLPDLKKLDNRPENSIYVEGRKGS